MSPAALIGSYSERTRCPRCSYRIRLEDVRIFVKPDGPYPKCPECGTSLRVSIVYRRLTTFVCFILAFLIPYFFGLRAYVVVAWIPFCLLTVMLVPNFAKVTLPPKLEDADAVARRSVLRRNVELLLSLWMFWAVVIFLNGIISEAVEGKDVFYRYLSGPLGWFDAAFVVRAETTGVGMFSIFIANTFVCAVFLFPLSVIFRAASRRGQVTQLGIYGSGKEQDEDDDDT